MGRIDQVILSCNEDPTYRDFWEITPLAYKKLFPGVRVHLAFLTWREETDPLVQYFRTLGDVTLFKPVTDVPEFAQAKMIRFILASEQGSDVCYIDDIDLIPLNREFITSKTDNRKINHLLCVGGEVYDNNGCYPVSQMTAEGYVWKRFINPDDKTYRKLMDEWKGETMFDRREDVCIKLDWSKDDYFSDERLLRRLTHNNPVIKQDMERGYTDYLDATIDRHTYKWRDNTWEYDIKKLKRGGFVNVHGARPYKQLTSLYQPIIDFINDIR